jgi:crotonobetainyl-CoA:carnitine CoA-transferase CaiB-like acyl-CoA transferase
MTEGALSFHLPMHSAMAAGQPQERGQGMLTGGLPCYNIYETADGKYLSVAPLEPKFWMGFVEAIGAPELAGEGMSSGEDGERTREKVAEIIATKTRDEWTAVFEEFDVCVEPILEPDEALFDELFEAREMFFELQGIQHTRTPLTPKDRDHTGAPALGQHTDDLLAELGYSDDDIAQLHEDDVL